MARREPLASANYLEKPFIVVSGPGGSSEVALSPGTPITVGRDAASDIVLASPVVSKHHAVIRYAGGECVVEDLESANGTLVNGQPIAVSVVHVGDRVQIGDFSLEVVDRGAGRRGRAGKSEAAQSSKVIRLGITALATMVVMLVLMLLMMPAEEEPAGGALRRADAGERTLLPPTPIATPDAAIVGPVLARAKVAGVGETDALFDEGSLQLRVGRLREAVHLLSAVLAREPGNQAAASRLSEARTALEEEVERRLAEAEVAFGQLRFNDAILDWEGVQSLVEPTDPRYATAAASVARARERMPRP